MHYLLANVLTVGVCAFANFIAADRMVFRTDTSRLDPPSGGPIRLKPDPTGCKSFSLLMLALAAGVARTPVEAAELRADTLDAFNRYVRLTESRMDTELRGQAPFLWVDQLGGSARQEAYARLKRGDDRGQPARHAGRRPDDRITARLDSSLDRDNLHSRCNRRANRRVDARVRSVSGDLRTQRAAIPHDLPARRPLHRLPPALHEKGRSASCSTPRMTCVYTQLTPSRVHVRSYSTRIAEVREPGTKAEAEAPVGNDSGFLWRFNNYCSLEGRAEGTYVQCESVSLSRAIPAGLGMDRRAVRDEHPEGIARVHAGQHAEGTDEGRLTVGPGRFRLQL